MSANTFALVENNTVLIYPITEDDINQRNNPAEKYYPCYYDEEPKYDNLTQQLVHIPRVVGNSVFVMYHIEDKDLDGIMTQLDAYIAGELAKGLTPTVQTLPNGMLGSIMKLTLKRVQESLDTFATTRGYDDIRSVATYATSTIEKFRLEGERAVLLRDQTWDSLYTFMGTVSAGGIPYPFTWETIQSNLPALTWE